VQVLFVLQDGNSKSRLVGESGSMNIFFHIREEGENGELELVTPPLDGLILPGVTRDSVLKLACGFGDMKVSERPLRFDEVRLISSRKVYKWRHRFLLFF
jgi:branched-chain amino acid aminotransferase